VDGEWQVEPPPAGGDTTNSDSAFYAWRVTAPAGLTIAASGTVVEATTTGSAQTQVMLTGPMRDLALVVGALETEERTVGGVLLRAHLLPRHAALADEVLDQAGAQVETLQTLVGDYPFAELDIVDAPGAFGGIEYPGLILIGIISPDRYFERANVHEVGHQWFYSLIGDDQLLQPWLDEAAASYTEVLYAEHVISAQAAQDALAGFWGYLAAADDPDKPIGLPVEAYDDDYGLIVYGKGALFFEALRREMGDRSFFDFLRAYYERYRYRFATSEGFHETAEATCACELDALFDLWVYEGGPVERP
jgi:aminopeptidase N